MGWMKALPLVMRFVISVILLLAALWVMMTSNFNDDPEMLAIAAGWVGGVVGYWLK